ncbi:DNA-directed DNA polymerase [Coemansia sp. Benny D115]|nr:DNA-directed DNA polymerase [Coemansia sp. Benny D115]
MSTTLEFYWGLASLDEQQRLDSAAQLIGTLVKFQRAMPQSTKMATTEEEMNELCASDVAYALKRLIKGLASPRDGARQGFSIALTELLARIPCISVPLVLSLLWRHTEAVGSMSNQEQRDMHFGRIFGLMALVQSGILTREGTTSADISKIVAELVAVGAKKPYLREIAYSTIVSMVPALGQFSFRDELITTIVAVALDKGVIETPEELNLALRLRRTYPDYDWYSALPLWQTKHMLSEKNVGKLASILSETSKENPAIFSTWHPQLHSVWNEIFDIYFNRDRVSEVQDKGVMSLEILWESVVEKKLFAPGSSQFRRYWGYLLLVRLLPHLNEESVPSLMTPRVVQALSESMSASKKLPLEKVSKQASEKLMEVCESDSKVGMAVLMHLLNDKKVNVAGDSAGADLRTAMANRIVAKLDGEAMAEYIAYLQRMFVEPKLAQTNVSVETADGSDDANQLKKPAERQRLWALDQMIRVAKNKTLPITDELVLRVLNFVTAAASFEVTAPAKGKASKKTVLEFATPPSPPISSSALMKYRSLLVSFVGDLSRSSARPAKKEGSAAATIGCSDSGIVWSTAVIKKLLEGDQQANVKVVLHSFDETRAVLKDMAKVLDLMEAKCVKYSSSSPADAQRFRALELLLGNVCILAAFATTDAAHEEYLEIIPDLNSCFENFAAQVEGEDSKKKGSKKAAKEEDDEAEPEPVEVLTDILISFMTKDSSTMRKLCEQIFVPFVGLMTADALDSIIGVLSAKEGVAGAEDDHIETQMEDIDGGDGEAHMDSGDDSGSGSDSDDDADAGFAGVVDEELRRKIQEALSGAAADGDAGEVSASGEEEEFDDEQMKVFDSKLEEIFRNKKQAKQDARDLKISFVNFKLRVLDLAEVFLKHTTDGSLMLKLLPAMLELAVSTSKDSRNISTHKRSLGILTEKSKRIPKNIAVDEGIQVLKTVHEYARRGSDKAALVMLENVAAQLACALLDSDPKSGALIEEIYQATLDDYMTRRASHVSFEFITTVISRLRPEQTGFIWRMAIKSLRLYGHPQRAVNVFRQLNAYMLAESATGVCKKLGNDDVADYAKLAEQLVRELQGALLATIEFAASEQNKESAPKRQQLDRQRLREIAKASVQIVRRCGKVEAMAGAVKAGLQMDAKWRGALEKLKSSPIYMTQSSGTDELLANLENLDQLVKGSATGKKAGSVGTKASPKKRK